MKMKILKFLSIALMISSFQISNAKYLYQNPILNQVQDSIVQNEVKTDTVISSVKTLVDEIPFQHLDLRVFKNIDIDSLKKHKSDLSQYLKDIDMMENVIKNNYKELNNQYNSIKKESNLINADYKLLDQKRKIIKLDEKLLKKEKKLRDKEMKAFKVEKKDFEKASKNMDQTEVDSRLMRFMDNQSRIENSNMKWEEKMEIIKSDKKILDESEQKILRKETDIKNRISELDRYKDSLKLKEKQLEVEKKQVLLEMKKAKLELKAANTK